VLQRRKHCIKKRGTKRKVSGKDVKKEMAVGEMNEYKTSQEIRPN
jgi:hypothetical protein